MYACIRHRVNVPEPSIADPCHPNSRLVELGPDVVIIGSSASDPKAIERMALHLAPLPIDVLVHSSQGGALGLGPIVHVGDIPFIRLYPKPLRAHQRLVKRAFDIAASATLLSLLLPLLLAVAALIKIDSPGPVLFRQPPSGWVVVTLRFSSFEPCTSPLPTCLHGRTRCRTIRD